MSDLEQILRQQLLRHHEDLQKVHATNRDWEGAVATFLRWWDGNHPDDAYAVEHLRELHSKKAPEGA